MKKILMLLPAIVLAVLMASLIYAIPQGPDTLTTDSSGNRTEGVDAVVVNTQAGNVTAMTINDIRITGHWAGFYGNVTGSITLDDAGNQTFFDWAIAAPSGEVYASNNSVVTWNKVQCENLTNNGTHPKWNHNATTLNRYFNINSTESDTFINTFNDTYTNSSGFDVGNVHIGPEQKCNLAYTYVNENAQAGAIFETILLTDNQSIIFTTLLENRKDGFRTGADPHDFQLLVAEDGIYNLATTPYYFFVEIQ